MNATPDSDVMKALGGKWTYAAPPDLLQPASLPRPRIRGDYVLYRPATAWRVVESSVIDDRVASDHRPVFAVLQRTDPR
jgi:endonuclease/exonuclease/phosphatase (EEP) superfamily protein YafD